MIEENYLPYFIHEDIYLIEEELPATKSLIEEKESNKTEETAPPPIIKEEKIHPIAIWTPPLTKRDKELIQNILTAINKDLEAAHLMEGINAYSPNYETLICFGYQKELELKLGDTLPLYQPRKVKTHQVLVSVPPNDLHTDKKQKALLWEALQKMFLNK